MLNATAGEQTSMENEIDGSFYYDFWLVIFSIIRRGVDLIGERA